MSCFKNYRERVVMDERYIRVATKKLEKTLHRLERVEQRILLESAKKKSAERRASSYASPKRIRRQQDMADTAHDAIVDLMHERSALLSTIDELRLRLDDAKQTLADEEGARRPEDESYDDITLFVGLMLLVALLLPLVGLAVAALSSE